MTTDTIQDEVGERPAEGRITDEAIAEARKMIGLQLRPEGPYLQDATPDTIRNFCNGIGDLNPLYRDLEHGRHIPLRHDAGASDVPDGLWLDRPHPVGAAGRARLLCRQ